MRSRLICHISNMTKISDKADDGELHKLKGINKEKCSAKFFAYVFEISYQGLFLHTLVFHSSNLTNTNDIPNINTALNKYNN